MFLSLLSAAAMAQDSDMMNLYGRAALQTNGRTVTFKSTSGILDASEIPVDVPAHKLLTVRLNREAGLDGQWWKFELTGAAKPIYIWARIEHININGDQFSIPRALLVPPQEFDLSGTRTSAQEGMARHVIEVHGCYRKPTPLTGLFGLTYHCEGRQVSEGTPCPGQRRVENIRTTFVNQISMTFAHPKGEAYTLNPAPVTIPRIHNISKTSCQYRPNEPDIQFSDRAAVR